MAQPLVGGVLGAGFGDLRGIADALEETAWHLAADVEETERFAAALVPTPPGVIDTLDKLKRRAELVGIAHAYFKEMHERPETPVVFDRAVYGVSDMAPAPVTKP